MAQALLISCNVIAIRTENVSHVVLRLLCQMSRVSEHNTLNLKMDMVRDGHGEMCLWSLCHNEYEVQHSKDLQFLSIWLAPFIWRHLGDWPKLHWYKHDVTWWCRQNRRQSQLRNFFNITVVKFSLKFEYTSSSSYFPQSLYLFFTRYVVTYTGRANMYLGEKWKVKPHPWCTITWVSFHDEWAVLSTAFALMMDFSELPKRLVCSFQSLARQRCIHALSKLVYLSDEGTCLSHVWICRHLTGQLVCFEKSSRRIDTIPMPVTASQSFWKSEGSLSSSTGRSGICVDVAASEGLLPSKQRTVPITSQSSKSQAMKLLCHGWTFWLIWILHAMTGEAMHRREEISLWDWIPRLNFSMDFELQSRKCKRYVRTWLAFATSLVSFLWLTN